MTERKKDERISRRAVEAAAVLLEVGNVRAAAKRLDVSERTLGRWITRDDFRDAYQQLSRDAYAQARGRLRRLACDATETLAKGLEGRVASIQARCAVAILDHAHKAELDEIERRLTALETQAGQ